MHASRKHDRTVATMPIANVCQGKAGPANCSKPSDALTSTKRLVPRYQRHIQPTTDSGAALVASATTTTRAGRVGGGGGVVRQRYTQNSH
eukprot:216263-Chlamydomonas_euryale.AAC.4